MLELTNTSEHWSKRPEHSIEPESTGRNGYTQYSPIPGDLELWDSFGKSCQTKRSRNKAKSAIPNVRFFISTSILCNNQNETELTATPSVVPRFSHLTCTSMSLACGFKLFPTPSRG